MRKPWMAQPDPSESGLRFVRQTNACLVSPDVIYKENKNDNEKTRSIIRSSNHGIGCYDAGYGRSALPRRER